MASNIVVLLSVFLLGAAVGALLLSIRRLTLMDRLREQFRSDLQAAVDEHAAQVLNARKPSKTREPDSDLQSAIPERRGRAA